MRIVFDATEQDFIEATARYVRHGPLHIRRKRGYFLWAAAVFGAALVWGPESWPGRLVSGAVAVAIFFPLVIWLTRLQLAGDVRSQIRPLLEGKTTIPIEVEIRDDGLEFSQAGMRICHDWSVIDKAMEGPGSIEVFGLQGFIGRIPDRAFPSDSDRLNFIQTINRRAQSRP
jgi:hypothetical protein